MSDISGAVGSVGITTAVIAATISAISALIVQRITTRWKRGDIATITENQAKLGLYSEYTKLVEVMRTEINRLSCEVNEFAKNEQECRKQLEVQAKSIRELESKNIALSDTIQQLKSTFLDRKK